MSNELNFTLIAQQLGKTQADELQKLLGSVENKEQITPIVNLFLESQRKLSQENTSLKHANSEVNLALEQKTKEAESLQKDLNKSKENLKKLNNQMEASEHQFELKLQETLNKICAQINSVTNPKEEECLTQARLTYTPSLACETILKEIKQELEFLAKTRSEAVAEVKALMRRTLNLYSKSEVSRKKLQVDDLDEKSLSSIRDIEEEVIKSVEERLDQGVDVTSDFREKDPLVKQVTEKFSKCSKVKKFFNYIIDRAKDVFELKASLGKKSENKNKSDMSHTIEFMSPDLSMSDQEKVDLVLSCLEESNNYVVEKELTTSGDELQVPFLEKDELEKAKQIASVENAVALGSYEFERLCPHCNKLSTFKITSIKRNNEVFHARGLSEITTNLEAVYKIKCSNCKHDEELPITDINLPLILSHYNVPQEQINKINAIFTTDPDKGLSLAAKVTNEHEESPIHDFSKEDQCRAKARSKRTVTELNLDNYCKDVKSCAKNKSKLRNQHIKHANHKANEIHEHADWQILPKTATYKTHIQTVPHVDNDGKTIELKIAVRTIEPSSFTRESFEASRLFRGCCLSVGLSTLAVALQSLYSPRNAIYRLFEAACNNDEFISRLEFNNYFKAIGRLLSIVNEQSKKDILKSTTVLCDETPIKLVTGQGTKQKYLWIIKTGNTEKAQECCIQYCGTRSAVSGLNMFDMFSAEECLFKYLLTDGYGAYDTILHDYSYCAERDPIIHCSCWAHYRRYIYVFLESSGLIEIYHELLPKGEELTSFPQKLKEYAKEHKMSATNVALLSAFYLINAIFSNDASVTDKYSDLSSEAYLNELYEVRQNKTSYLVVMLNKIMEFLTFCQHLIVPSKNNKTFVSSKMPQYSSKLTRAVLYWMKDRKQLSEFLHNPHIECSTNSVERSLRSTVIAKRASMTFNSSAGISSFANIMTVIQNCRLANISPFEYIPWYIYNLKLRALDIANSEELVDYVDSINKEVSEISGESFDFRNAIFSMPRSREIKELVTNEENKLVEVEKTIDCYDKRNISAAWLSFIPTQGLTVKDYAKLKNQGL